jgi:hypothetical protein
MFQMRNFSKGDDMHAPHIHYRPREPAKGPPPPHPLDWEEPIMAPSPWAHQAGTIRMDPISKERQEFKKFTAFDIISTLIHK